MPGPPKTNPKVTNLRGTTKKCRAEQAKFIDLPLVDEIPEPPNWLPNIHAQKEFERLAPILHANKLLTEAGLTALAHLCALHGKLVQLWSAGESPTGHMLSQYRNLINDFGLTPVSQGKVKISDSKSPGNRFNSFKKATDA